MRFLRVDDTGVLPSVFAVNFFAFFTVLLPVFTLSVIVPFTVCEAMPLLLNVIVSDTG